jgi:hypothetical protein
MMRLFRRERHGYADDKQISRRDAWCCAAFILAVAVIVAKVAALRFDRLLIATTAGAVLLLLLTRYKLAYIAAALLWMAFRCAFAFAVSGRPLALGFAAGFGAAGCGVVALAARREL